jgi:hypothetical protein
MSNTRFAYTLHASPNCGTLSTEKLVDKVFSNRGLRLHGMIGEYQRQEEKIPASLQRLDVKSEYGATCGKHHATSLTVKEQSGYPAPTTETSALISQIAEFTKSARSLQRTCYAPQKRGTHNPAL